MWPGAGPTAATAHERRPRTDRANFGLVETAGRPVTVRLSAIFADGTSLDKHFASMGGWISLLVARALQGRVSMKGAVA